MKYHLKQNTAFIKGILSRWRVCHENVLVPLTETEWVPLNLILNS